MADWLAEVRASAPADDYWYRPEDKYRLLAAAEALAELVALHDGSQTQRPSRWETAWERARRALAGEGDG